MPLPRGGLIKKGQKAETKPVEDFNQNLNASAAGIDRDILSSLTRATGATVDGERIVPAQDDATVDRFFPRNSVLDPDLVHRRLESIARPDAVDISTNVIFPSDLPSGSLVTIGDIRSAVSDAAAIFPPSLLKGLRRLEVITKPLKKSVCGTYLDGTITLSEHVLQNPGEMRATVLHELVHAIFDDAPSAGRIRRQILRHFKSRTRNDVAEPIGGKWYLRDMWYVVYAGEETGVEVASHYVELLCLPSGQLSKLMEIKAHRDTFELVMTAFGIEWRQP